MTLLGNTFYTSKRNESLNKSSCFYCNCKEYTPNTCYMRILYIPSVNYVWVEKGTNLKGPKKYWVP